MQAEEVYLWHVFTAEGNTNAMREHNTWPVGETCQVQTGPPRQCGGPRAKILSGAL